MWWRSQKAIISQRIVMKKKTFKYSKTAFLNVLFLQKNINNGIIYKYPSNWANKCQKKRIRIGSASLVRSIKKLETLDCFS